MMGKTELSIETRAVIVALSKEGYSFGKIAEKTKVSQSAVTKTLKRNKETGSNFSRQRSGRPRNTSNHEDKLICIRSKRDRTRTVPELCAELNLNR